MCSLCIEVDRSLTVRMGDLILLKVYVLARSGTLVLAAIYMNRISVKAKFLTVELHH